MKANKLLAVAVLSAATLLTACTKPAPSSSAASSQAASTPASSEAVTTKKAKIGLGYDASYEVYDHSKKLVNQLTVNVAAVAFADDGKIIDCRFDSIQVKCTYEAGHMEGETDVGYKPGSSNVFDNEIKSKLELGTRYGMLGSAYGSKLAEVDTQIEAYADFCVGKTVAQVLANEAAITGVTISVDGFNAALESAKARMRGEFTYSGNIFAGVGMKGSFENGHNGIEAAVAINASIVGDDNKVAASFSDDVVLDFDAATTVAEADATTGAKVGDINIKPKATQKYVVNNKITSKYDLGSAYGMLVSYGSTFAEWDTQAKNFDAYIVGKTSAQIAELELTKDKGGMTITSDGFTGAAAEAAKYAKMEHVGPQAEAK